MEANIFFEYICSIVYSIFQNYHCYISIKMYHKKNNTKI